MVLSVAYTKGLKRKTEIGADGIVITLLDVDE